MAPAAAALPLVKTLRECGDFDKTVLAYLPQLRELPQKILDSISDPEQLKLLYLETNPLVTAFAFVLFICPIFLIFSEINRNYSQVDRFWSLLPTVFIAHFVTWAHLVDLPTKRLDNVIAFSILWSGRLTFNYWRRGGYQIGSEDYRWEKVQNYVNNRAIFFLFNVVFISSLQVVLLFLITTPTYVFLLASSVQGNEITFSDLVFSRFLIFLIVIEFLADQQQWTYHQAKAQYQKTAKVPPGYKQEDLDRGFLTSGLWAWSRHPNFAAEQAIWLTLYQWSCYETYVIVNWTLAGCLSYLLLFQGSTWLTELLSASKYPEYREYQRRVSKFLPKLATALTGPVPKPGETAAKAPPTKDKTVAKAGKKSKKG